jgi:hypothetical protein
MAAAFPSIKNMEVFFPIFFKKKFFRSLCILLSSKWSIIKINGLKEDDILILKAIEFQTKKGQRVKISEIPVLEEDNPFYVGVRIRLETMMTRIYYAQNPRPFYSFRDYLKKVLRWPDYEQLYGSSILKNNA